jgi:hypothetical protein
MEAYFTRDDIPREGERRLHGVPYGQCPCCLAADRLYPEEDGTLVCAVCFVGRNRAYCLPRKARLEG